MLIIFVTRLQGSCHFMNLKIEVTDVSYFPPSGYDICSKVFGQPHFLPTSWFVSVAGVTIAKGLEMLLI